MYDCPQPRRSLLYPRSLRSTPPLSAGPVLELSVTPRGVRQRASAQRALRTRPAASWPKLTWALECRRFCRASLSWLERNTCQQLSLEPSSQRCRGDASKPRAQGPGQPRSGAACGNERFLPAPTPWCQVGQGWRDFGWGHVFKGGTVMLTSSRRREALEPTPVSASTGWLGHGLCGRALGAAPWLSSANVLLSPRPS